MFQRLAFTSLPARLSKVLQLKGYSTVLGSNIDPDGAGDIHEGFQFSWEVPDDTPGSLSANRLNDGAMAGANVWPDVLGLREALLGY